MKCTSATLLVLSALLTGCIPAPDGPRRPSKRPVATLPDNATLRQCTGDLNRIGARYEILPDRYAGSCTAINTVRLESVGVPVSNLTATQCPLAKAFAQWARGNVQPAARDAFGSGLARIETMGSYACRQVKGNASTRLSEHAFANAIDVSGFVLANGRRITIEGGWRGADDEQEFLRRIRAAACQRFQTVLSPDYNAAHYNHLHLDMGRGPYCR